MLKFNNKFYGSCYLSPVDDVEIFNKVFKTDGILEKSSLADLPNKNISSEKLIQLYNINLRTHNKHTISLYALYSEADELLGLSGFFCETEGADKYLELCFYILPRHQNKRLASDSSYFLLDYAFTRLPDFSAINMNKSSSGLSLDKIIADAFPENLSSRILSKFGFIKRKESEQFLSENTRQYGQVRYELSREQWGLYKLSKILFQEKSNILPRIFSPGKINMERARRLWFAYFDKGVMLSNGGVESSFISAAQVREISTITTFNGYRSDRPQSVILNLADIKKFLIDESVISQTNAASITPVFTLGGHEGYTRLLRSLYQANKNEEILYPESGYGFLAVSAETMKPCGYRLRMIKNIYNNGEKIDINHLKTLAKKHRLAKTLFLEVKTIAGAVYTEDEMSSIITLCKQNDLFLIIDLAHINMYLNFYTKFPDVINLCINQDFFNFCALYTASKTYGMERARIGFAIFCNNISKVNIPAYSRDLYREVGSVNDLSFELAQLLIQASKIERAMYLQKNNDKHRLNMNILLGYLLGVNTSCIDEDLRVNVKGSIPISYHQGIPGMQIVNKPECGIHIKVNISNFIGKYYSNIEIFNSEIFCYVLCGIFSVVTLHSFQIMDSSGMTLRIGFSILQQVHNGLQAMHNFVRKLSDTPDLNRHMNYAIYNKEYFSQNPKEKMAISKVKPTENLTALYKYRLANHMKFYKLPGKVADSIVNEAAKVIQKKVITAFNFSR